MINPCLCTQELSISPNGDNQRGIVQHAFHVGLELGGRYRGYPSHPSTTSYDLASTSMPPTASQPIVQPTPALLSVTPHPCSVVELAPPPPKQSQVPPRDPKRIAHHCHQKSLKAKEALLLEPPVRTWLHPKS